MGLADVLLPVALAPLLVSCLTILLVLAYNVRVHLRLPSLPGSFFSSISDLPRLLSVAYGHAHFDAIRSHRKYGPVVRVGPNTVSFADADALPAIYSVLTKFEKSDFYSVFDAKTPHGFVSNVFSVRSEKRNRDIKRPIAGAYSMTTLLELEGLTDECIAIFQNKIEEKLSAARKDATTLWPYIEMNLGEWLHWYAFDLITSITFSNMLGFMETETDVEGIIDAIEGRMKYSATIGQWPALHKYLLGNSFVSWLADSVPITAKLNTAPKIVQFAAKQLRRYGSKEATAYADMLDRFKRVRNDGTEQMNDTDVLMAAVANVIAGSDTTAISLRAVFYYLIKTPLCMKKLIEEIDDWDRQGNLSEIVTFAESSEMVYLQAVLKEAMRMHPAVGLMLERVVPDEGLTIGGFTLPAGTVIGANPWVMGRDRDVYGDDADTFRPERWVDVWEGVKSQDNNIADLARTNLKNMERNFLAFGMGSRSCLGKNISLLEMNKLVPQLLRRYRVELVQPEKEWSMQNYWFVYQSGLNCRISKREI